MKKKLEIFTICIATLIMSAISFQLVKNGYLIR